MVTVIGGGLGGLAAAITAAEAGVGHPARGAPHARRAVAYYAGAKEGPAGVSSA